MYTTVLSSLKHTGTTSLIQKQRQFSDYYNNNNFFLIELRQLNDKMLATDCYYLQ